MKAKYFYRLCILVFLLPNIFYGQSLPSDVNLEVLSNKEVYEIFLDGPRQLEAARLISKNAIIYWNYNNHDSSLILFKMAGDIFLNLESYDELKAVYTNMGSIYIEKSDFNSSLEYYNRSLEISKQTGNLSEVATKKIDLSNVYMRNNQTDKAIQMIDDAMEIARNENNHDIVLNCFSQISEIYNNNGEAWKSREYQLRYNHYMDSVEGNYYNIESALAHEQANYVVPEQEVVQTIVPKKKTAIKEKEVKHVVENEEFRTVAKIDYMAERKKQVFQSVDSNQLDNNSKFDTTILAVSANQEVTKTSIITPTQFLIGIISLVVIILIILFVLYKRK